jgi:3-hydroxyisobutyrate dehydrogenase
MGSAIARRFIAAGIDILLWNRSKEALQPFLALNAPAAESVDALVAASDVILMMLSDDRAVVSALGLNDADRAMALVGKIVVNMGTGSPEMAIAHEAAIRAVGGTYIECPVSGSRQPAEEGRLLAMVAGGIVEQRSLVRQLIAPVCRASIDAGSVPNGLLMKLAVNLYLVTTVAALAESFNFADRLGIDAHRFAELIELGPMASDVAVSKGRKIADRDFAVQAAISDVVKNCRLVADAATNAGAAAPLLAQATMLFEAQDGENGTRLDMAAVIDSFGMRNGGPDGS